jgi:hypothetical protein
MHFAGILRDCPFTNREIPVLRARMFPDRKRWCLEALHFGHAERKSLSFSKFLPIGP